MTSKRRASALVVAPTVVAGLLTVPVMTWTQVAGPATPPVGEVPEPHAYALAAYATGGSSGGDVADDPRLEDAVAADGSTPEDDGHDLEKVVDSPVVPTEDFRLAGVTWEQGTSGGEVVAYVRTRGDDGWTAWYQLHESVDGPDPGSEEARNARAGTDPLLVDDSDAVQVVLATSDGQIPEDVQVDVVGLGDGTSTGDDGDTGEEQRAPAPEPEVDGTDLEPMAAAGGVPMPTIRSRAAWGANERIREKSSPDYGSVRGAVVHHTAGPTSYSKDEVPALIRSFYSYHVKVRGWRDIGYNVLVDKWGRAWEGRWGGLSRNVVGAHALNNNSTTFGISVIGDFGPMKASKAVARTVSRVIAWKFSLNRVNPNGTWTYTTNTGKRVSKPKVVGHRDVGQTACPGSTLYKRLPGIRSRVRSRMANNGLKPTIRAAASPKNYQVGGNRVDVDVTVTAPGTVPTGTVEILDVDSDTIVGGPVSLSSGKARVKLLKLLPAGTRPLRVLYSGNGLVAWARSTSFGITVRKAPTTTTATYDKTAITSGDLVRASVVVAGDDVYPRGTASVWSGGTRVGRATLTRVPSTKRATATVRLSRELAGGTHRLVARYDGHPSIAGSKDATPGTLTVAKAPSRITSVAHVRVPRWKARPVLRVTASAEHQRPDGPVVVRDRGRVVGRGSMRDGVATVWLTRNDVRRRTVTVQYHGSASLRWATPVTRTFAVKPAVLQVRRRLDDRTISRSDRLVLRMRVKAAGHDAVRGRIQVVTKSGRVLKSKRLRARHDGHRKIRIPVSWQGKKRIRVKVDPAGYQRPYRSKWIKVRVR
ncbi:Ig-like domain-containing protein [Mumia flava]|uniref:Ig-like domain-containing protein n=1 Tax=Mumia flava TaxID=1348852 RepID=A0A2M9B841_9ACTN|nr:Ig-like domain repeat protein [Mumia flava]PJJ54133.1 Ig-like domain-containing protein [Mumia flava]